MKKGDKIPIEIRQTILETETKDDVIDITLAMIDLHVPILYEPRYTKYLLLIDKAKVLKEIS